MRCAAISCAKCTHANTSASRQGRTARKRSTEATKSDRSRRSVVRVPFCRGRICQVLAVQQVCLWRPTPTKGTEQFLPELRTMIGNGPVAFSQDEFWLPADPNQNFRLNNQASF